MGYLNAKNSRGLAARFGKGFLATIVIGCSGFLGCGADLATRVENAPLSRTIPAALTGELNLVAGQNFNFANDSQPKVVIFASDTCAICREEAIELTAYFQSRGGPPTNTTFVSILVGAFLEDALIWRDELNVPWHVGIENGDRLFRAFCPEGRTPCVVTSNPQTGFIQSRTGKVSKEILEEETGPWTF